MPISQHELSVRTAGRGTYEITRVIADRVHEAGVDVGLCNVFVHHTSASLIISENADTDVRGDLDAFLARLVPDGDPLFVHTAEGPDDMSAHVRSVLTATTLTIPVRDGALALGTWQGIYVWEHRLVPHVRRVSVTVLG